MVVSAATATASQMLVSDLKAKSRIIVDLEDLCNWKWNCRCLKYPTGTKVLAFSCFSLLVSSVVLTEMGFMLEVEKIIKLTCLVVFRAVEAVLHEKVSSSGCSGFQKVQQDTAINDTMCPKFCKTLLPHCRSPPNCGRGSVDVFKWRKQEKKEEKATCFPSISRPFAASRH